MDPLTIIGLVSNIISFIDFGQKVVKNVREIRVSAAGVTQDALHHEFIAQQMRDFANKLIPPDNNGDEEYKGVVLLAKECRRVAEDIQKLIEKIKPKDPGSFLRSLGSGIKGPRYEKELSTLQVKMDRYRDQLLVQLNFLTTSEVKDQLVGLARDFDKNGDRIIKLQKQVEELERTVKTSDGQLRQGIRDLLGLSHPSYVSVHSHRLLENLRFDDMDSRFETVPYAHESTFEWIFGHRENSNGDGPDGYHNKIREEFGSWLSSEDGIYHIAGKLGSGKSALTKFLYLNPRTKELLKKWAGHSVLIRAHFFFWGPGSRLQHSVRGLYRALLYKTLSKIPTLIPEVLPKQWKEIQSKPWQVNAKVDFTLKTLEHALSRLVCCQSEDLRICFFIDGLDECKDDERRQSDSNQHRHLAQSLSHWCGESKGRVKLVASSREYNVFLENLPSKRRLHMQRLTEEDMKIYIRDRMSFARQREGWTTLVDSIINKADGIFLWVALVTSRLQYLHESKVGWDRLKQEIDQAPEGLNDLFNHIIRSLATSDLRRAYRTFAIHQKLRECNLFLPLLSYPFIDHYTGDSDIDSCAFPSLRRIHERDLTEQARRMLMGYCGGLFEPARTIEPLCGPETIISFTHRSLAEFIKSLDTREMERHLRDFCVADAASYLFLAYLWAKDATIHEKNGLFMTLRSWLENIALHMTNMRKDAKIRKAPFHFEEQLCSALVRLGAKTITDQDIYKLIGIQSMYDCSDNETAHKSKGLAANLGRERRRVDNVAIARDDAVPVTSKQDPNLERVGIRTTSVDIISEEILKEKTKLMALGDRNDGRTKEESGTGSSDVHLDEQPGDALIVNKADNAGHPSHDYASPRYKGKRNVLTLCILGRCSAWDDLTTLTSIQGFCPLYFCHT